MPAETTSPGRPRRTSIPARPGGPSVARRTIVAGVAAAILGACSTAAMPPEGVECLDDRDCELGFVCNLATLDCESSGNDPPRRYLGLDVQERSDGLANPLRNEVFGCDREVIKDSAALPTLEVPRSLLIQTFRLRVFAGLPTEPITPEDTLPAELELSQPSRFARSFALRRSVAHPTVSDESTLLDTSITWPRYHPDNPLPEQLDRAGFVLWTINPSPNARGTAPASRYQMLVPKIAADDAKTCRPDRDLDCCPEDDEDCTLDEVRGTCVTDPNAGEDDPGGICRRLDNPVHSFGFVYEPSCDRGIVGRTLVLGSPQSPIPDASIVVRHEGQFGVPGMGEPAPLCERNQDCLAPDQLCGPQSGRCELNLASRLADTASTDETGEFTARVYTYCEGQLDSTLERTFSATVTPAAGVAVPGFETPRVLPSLNFEFPVTFLAELTPPTNPSAPIEANFCIPDWGEARSFSLSLVGDPVRLTTGPEGDYVCCDVECLPVTETDAMGGPPPSPPSCAVSNARLETDVIVDAELEAIWNDPASGCLRPAFGPDRIAGVQRPSIDCPGDGSPCSISNVARGSDQAPRSYRLRVVSPSLSVLGSIDRLLDIGSNVDDLVIELPRRRLLTGQVRLPDALCEARRLSQGCGSEGAVVIAERLRMPDEDESTVPGPYFHEVTTFWDPQTGDEGRYVLPLDPGVYLVTALPASGSSGGPAPIEIVDLTEDDDTWDPELDPGVLVTVDVNTFDRSAQAIPLDLGSWDVADLRHPGPPEDPEASRNVDLNDPVECLTDPGRAESTGCRIRRMIAGGSLPPSQLGQVRFAARDLGERGRSCPN